MFLWIKVWLITFCCIHVADYRCHCRALLCCCTASMQNAALQSNEFWVVHSFSEISRWLLENGPLLSPSRNKDDEFKTAQWLRKVDKTSGLDAASTALQLLIVTSDATLWLVCKVADVLHIYSYHKSASRHIYPQLIDKSVRCVASRIVGNSKHYMNNPMFGTIQLQRVQHALEHVLCSAVWSVSITKL